MVARPRDLVAVGALTFIHNRTLRAKFSYVNPGGIPTRGRAWSVGRVEREEGGASEAGDRWPVISGQSRQTEPAADEALNPDLSVSLTLSPASRMSMSLRQPESRKS